MRLATLTVTALLLSLAACDAKESSPSSEDAPGAKPKDPDPKKTAAADADPAFADNVDLTAAKQAFGCDAPKDEAAKRACQGLAAFAKAGKVTSYASEGDNVFAARSDCTKQPHDMIRFAIADLSAGAPSDDIDEARRPVGVVKIRFESWPRRDGKAALADRIVGELRDGKPLSKLTPEEADAGPIAKDWTAWKEKWAIFAPEQIRTVQSDAKSLLEQPKPTAATSAYWRETGGNLIRVAPPSGDWGWCVNHYFPVPE